MRVHHNRSGGSVVRVGTDVRGTVGNPKPRGSSHRHRAAERLGCSDDSISGLLADMDECLTTHDGPDSCRHPVDIRIQAEHLRGTCNGLGNSLPVCHGHRHHTGLDVDVIKRAALDPALANAMQHLAARRARTKILATDHFGEPAWDMILDLFIAARLKRHVSVWSACAAAQVPETTALRYLKRLVDQRVVLRTPDTEDKRRVNVTLSPEVYRRMEDWALELAF
jgi:hypothetical protein